MTDPKSKQSKNTKFKSIDSKIDLVENSSTNETNTRLDESPKNNQDNNENNNSSTSAIKTSVKDPGKSNLPEIEIPKIAGFEIEELIGKGGMGSVFKAKKTDTGETVALKILSNDLLEDTVALKRFKQEAQSASQLSHPNLVNVHGYGTTDDGVPFLEMEYFDGPSLSTIISREGYLNTEKAIEILSQICDGLSYAHESGIIHRDIKPSNVIILQDADGSIKVKLLDFGIALIRSQGGRETQDLTKTGDVLGSPQYMSPEQCLGFMLDARSDIYSLGCVIYELVTGKPPFAGENPVQLVVSHINEKAPAFQSEYRIGKKVKNLEKVAKRCLNKEQSDRYQTVSELKSDLEKVSKGQSVDTYLTDEKVKASITTEQLRFCYAGIFAFIVIAFIAIPEYMPANIAGSVLAAIVALLALAGAASFSYLGFYKLKFLLAKNGTIRQWMHMSFSLSLASALAFSTPFFANKAIEGLTSTPNWIDLICHSFFMLAFVFCCSSIASFMGYFLGRSSEKVSSLFCKIWVPLCTCVLVVGSFFAFPKYMSGVITTTADYAEEINPDFALALHRLNQEYFPVPEYAKFRSINLLTQHEKYKEAIEELTKRLAKEEDLSLLNQRMHLYFKTGQYENARDDILQAHKIDPKVGCEISNLEAKILVKEGKYDLAIDKLKESIKIFPGYGNAAYIIRASINYERGNTKAAFADLDMICNRGDNKNVNCVIRGIFKDSLGQKKDAESDFQRAIEEAKKLREERKKRPYFYFNSYQSNLALSYAAKRLKDDSEYKYYTKESKGRYYSGLDKDLISQLDLEESGIKIDWPKNSP